MKRETDRDKVDVIIIGAGAAGLAAAHGLSGLNLNVVILEARDRIGGRIFTINEPSLPGPVELGAEFIHGKPDVLLAGIYKSGLAIHETSGDSWICDSHGPKQADDVEKAWDGISKEMLRTNGPDCSFESFLVTSKASPADKQLARKYVEGFHAADPGRVSIYSLAVEKQTSDRLKGNRLFRVNMGYAALMQWYASNRRDRIRVNAQVRRVEWSKGKVNVTFSAGAGGQREVIAARAAIVTVPLPILQQRHDAASIHFAPDLPAKRAAALRLEMGQVVKMTFHFATRIWERPVPNLGFLFCPQKLFPTWWTLSQKAEVITGWAGGPDADKLLTQSPDERLSLALRTLSDPLNLDVRHLKRALRGHYFHDWSRDPFALGAYTYTPTHALDARSELAEPVEQTIFFAGEAAATTGDHGTVHGALASGYLAARKVVAAIAT